MSKGIVGVPDLTPEQLDRFSDWLKSSDAREHEIHRQLLLGFRRPGNGLSLDQLQKFIEHQNPFGRVPRWCEENNIIYFSVTAARECESGWVKRLGERGCDVSYWAKVILNSPSFIPARNKITEVAVLKGAFFSDSDRHLDNIRAETKSRGWAQPDIEIAPLIRENFSDEDLKNMGLRSITVMHKLVLTDGNQDLLVVGYDDEGDNLLYARCGCSSRVSESPDRGFAFTVSQTEF